MLEPYRHLRTRFLVVCALWVAAASVWAVILTRDHSRAHEPAPRPATRPVALEAWGYRPDPGAVGLAHGWARRAMPTRPVTVPWSPNARAVSGVKGTRAFEGSVGWYRRRVRVRRSGPYALRFASASFRADVWVDGRHVAMHRGAYEPFEARVRLRAARPAVVTVRVDWRDPAGMKAQGYGRGWFNYGGLNGPVTLMRVPATELSGLGVETRLEGGGRAARVALRVRVANHGAPRRLAVTGVLAGAGRRIAVRFAGRELAHGSTQTLRAVVRVPRPALWAPGRPDRYDLRLEAPGGGALRARVGLREISWQDGRLELNGRPLVLRGAGLPLDAAGHGDALTGGDEARIVAELRAAGANATRAQRPLDESLLERLDAAGILVWQEVGPWDGAADWTARTPALRASARRRVIETVTREQPHPSVLAWSLANEAAGDGHPGGQAGWVDAMARQLHRRDPTRPVGVDVWGRHLPHAPSLMYEHLDAVGFTDYLGWYESPGAQGAALDQLIAARVSGLHAIFPGKVLVATEFGAAGNALNPADALGGYRSQADLIASHVAAYRRSIPLVSGMLVWNLRDYAVHPAFAGGSIADTGLGVRLSPGLNEKGLFDGAGRPKAALAATRRAFAALPR